MKFFENGSRPQPPTSPLNLYHKLRRGGGVHSSFFFDACLSDMDTCTHLHTHTYIQKFIDLVREEMGSPSAVKDGKFGAKMDVNLCNDGPVTMQIEFPG